MVKFSKQFEAQLVPEWKEAFVDYWLLKKDLKRMQVVGDNKSDPHNRGTEPSLVHRLFKKRIPFFRSNGNREHGAIQVHRKLGSSASENDFYETELLDQFEDNEVVKEFFSRLDLQLNKVNQFYKGKEKEYLDRGESLHKQMEILLELKAALKQQQQQRGKGILGTDSKDDPSISCSIISEEDSTRGAIDQTEQNSESLSRELGSLTSEQDQLSMSQRLDSIKYRREEGNKFRSLSGRVVSCQGKNVKINIPLTTPSRTFSALTDLVWEDLVNQSKKGGNELSNNKLSVNKTKLHHAEKMIRGAYIELYKGLGYLKTYRNLNMLAFVKILKKFDKVTQKQVSSTYLKVVESSYFNSSDKAVKLTDEVEELFIKQFAEDDKRKAMKYLKPHQRKESHTVTFFIGLFAGCFMALFTGYCIMAHLAGMYTSRSNSIYMETAYPVLSMFSLLFLHLFLYGCNIFMWRKTRINYAFIFEFAPTKELKYRDVLLICTACMTIVVGSMFAHLALILKGDSSTQVQAIPGILVLMFLLLLVCPFNVLYKSTRFLFLRILRNIILSPLYKVVMVDFFMADQLCSQVPMLRSLEYVACYYITGSYKTQDYGYCYSAKHFRDLAYAVSFLPYYWRAMQCARRWFDEGDMGHLINLGKYVSAMLAAGAKVAYEREKSPGWLVLVVAMSSGATVYQLYWDFVKDWGLLQANSKNPWLRNDLILKRKFVYYLSMGLNLVLRLAWLQTVIHPNLGSLDSRVTSFLLAALEVIRRGHWNFYRLENEHLNNAGKFRAVKTVPLPFHEVDQD
ncbi:Phosphate transporter PHO1 1 [Rhynchospora pubera]|uniref:Phosphate transporter PHO1 1 n=1 Tax=Rhynchospora pubera TaxID=906938 RepID=A0AAV8HRU5_9POAL|nr:Phosphate transporter PHO1 1 [Rhynchospora pubera]